MTPTVAEVLERHEVRVRMGKALCPAHPDTNPSMSVHEDYVYCFTCLWTADAAGLEALLSKRPVTAVLHEWGREGVHWSALRPLRPAELRHDQWIDWVEWSHEAINEARQNWIMLAPVGFDATDWDILLRQAEPILNYVWDLCKPVDPEDELSPATVRERIMEAKNMLRRWSKWVAQ